MPQSSASNDHALHLRITRLERANRLLQWSIIAALGIAVAGFAPTRADVPDLLQARRIQLLDAEGRVRMDLADLAGTEGRPAECGAPHGTAWFTYWSFSAPGDYSEVGA